MQLEGTTVLLSLQESPSPPRGREWGRRADEVVGAPDAVPPLAPTMSLIPRGRHGTPQLYAHHSGGTSHQLSPFAQDANRASRLLASPYAFYVPPTPLPPVRLPNPRHARPRLVIAGPWLKGTLLHKSRMPP